MPLPTPHLDKINAAMQNEKMPEAAINRVHACLELYNQWIADMLAADGTQEEIVTKLIGLFNDYKFNVDYNIIFTCEEDFFYRQKGQLKLDNTIIEEFLPSLECIKRFSNIGRYSFCFP